MSKYYILSDRVPVLVDHIAWAEWYASDPDRCVARDEFAGVTVSTVFLGLNHQFGEGPPLIFETMIFGGEHDQWQERCSTWDEAVVMHARAKTLAELGDKDIP